MASVTFKRGTKAEIESTQIQDGQLLMETDQLNNNKIYLDLPNGTRVPVGGSGAWVGTQEEFELAVEEGKIADGTQVIITDDYESGITASMTLYSNAQSGLVATNVQSAIDEVSAKIGQENISQVGNSVTGAINNLNSNLNNVFNDLSFTVWVTTGEQEHAIKGNYFLYFLVNNSKQLIEYGIFISNSKIVLEGNNVLSLSISNNVLKYKSNSSTGYLSIISIP